jgi:hypothetical protein
MHKARRDQPADAITPSLSRFSRLVCTRWIVLQMPRFTASARAAYVFRHRNQQYSKARIRSPALASLCNNWISV